MMQEPSTRQDERQALTNTRMFAFANEQSSGPVQGFSHDVLVAQQILSCDMVALDSDDSPDPFDLAVDAVLGDQCMAEDNDSLEELLLAEKPLSASFSMRSRETAVQQARPMSVTSSSAPVLARSLSATTSAVPEQQLNALRVPQRQTRQQPPKDARRKPTKKAGPKEEESQQLKKPKRSLSAYNLFFQDERKKLLAALPSPDEDRKPRKSHGKIGFAQMARTIAARWKAISENLRLEYEVRAAVDGERYDKEMAIWKKWNTEREMAEWRQSMLQRQQGGEDTR